MTYKQAQRHIFSITSIGVFGIYLSSCWDTCLCICFLNHYLIERRWMNNSKNGLCEISMEILRNSTCEKCPQWDLWKWNSPQHCIGVEAEISQAHISKPRKIKLESYIILHHGGSWHMGWPLPEILHPSLRSQIITKHLIGCWQHCTALYDCSLL